MRWLRFRKSESTNVTDLKDGQSCEMSGSGVKPYVLKNTGGVYSCSCPAWRNQSIAIEKRSCKHLRKLRGDQAEQDRVGKALPRQAPSAANPAKEEPPLLLAHNWDNSLDIAGWWMSEKLDGVRAYWDGKRFLSRQGNEFFAPDWFTEGLPRMVLDGELWMGRKQFQKTVSIVRRQDRSDAWRKLRYMVFDAPSVAGGFEIRIKALQKTLARKLNKFAKALAHEVCRDAQHLQAELKRVNRLGGEGLMLRQPGSHYEAGRSTTLLKVKTFHDTEAVVIGHEAGRGKHKGRLGALRMQLPDGTEFSLGTGFSDKERQDPPPVGASVTFQYQELSDGGVPRFPSFLRVRPLTDGAVSPLRKRPRNMPSRSKNSAAPQTNQTRAKT